MVAAERYQASHNSKQPFANALYQAANYDLRSPRRGTALGMHTGDNSRAGRRYFTTPATGFAAAPAQAKLVIVQLPLPFCSTYTMCAASRIVTPFFLKV